MCCGGTLEDMTEVWTSTMGDRGRLVVPAGLRQKLGWEAGTTIHFVAKDEGIEVMDQETLMNRVQADFAGLDLVSELLAERRAEAARDLAETEEMITRDRGRSHTA